MENEDRKPELNPPKKRGKVEPWGMAERIDKWAQGMESRIDRWGKRQEERVKRLDQRADRWGTELPEKADRWGIRQTVALYRKLALGVIAELPTTDKVLALRMINDPWAFSEFTGGYGRAHKEFLEDFEKLLTRETKYLPEEKKSRRARFITATTVDEFLTQAQRIKKEERFKQFLLTARQVFFAGIRHSEQFAPGKIDPLWVHEIQGKIINQIANPGVELTPLRDQLRLFVDNPPLPARNLEAPSQGSLPSKG